MQIDGAIAESERVAEREVYRGVACAVDIVVGAVDLVADDARALPRHPAAEAESFQLTRRYRIHREHAAGVVGGVVEHAPLIRIAHRGFDGGDIRHDLGAVGIGGVRRSSPPLGNVVRIIRTQAGNGVGLVRPRLGDVAA